VAICPSGASVGGGPSAGWAGLFVAVTLLALGAAVWLPRRRAA